MARFIGSKNKQSRREGFDLFNKGTKLRRATVKPGMHGAKRAGKQTEYGLQLRSKQRAKRMYGIMERQFRNYVLKAGQTKGNIRDTLVSLLETRLDNVVYRLGWTPTRPAARQLVSHGHVRVNNKIMNVPSYVVKIEDEIQLDETAQQIPAIKEQEEDKKVLPNWLVKNGYKGKIIRMPIVEDLKEPVSLAEIIEFYSR